MSLCPNGGIGIRVRLKIEWRNPYGFQSHFGHHENPAYEWPFFICHALFAAFSVYAEQIKCYANVAQ